MVRTWADGWAVSRRTPAPVEWPWGVHIQVADDPHEVGRHVLPRAEEELVRAATACVTQPRTWLKTPIEPEDLEPWLPDGWVVAWQDTGHLMAVDLLAARLDVPEGYAVRVEQVGAVVHVNVLHAASGERAAKGQLAVLGESVVVDRVRTEDAHRRKGLGKVVMRALANRALDGGAVLGVLGATDSGRALYETLGWKKHATLAEGVYRPGSTGA
ncbi:GNAT family N-acetyltransferase [Streptomyces sp. NPDC006660]|uniref:GNAT family N-acetyltransferase n=1 Tax=Streptomyces sp. NPDC006660 TaxID=3156901 RepID=UPI003408FFFF